MAPWSLQFLALFAILANGQASNLRVSRNTVAQYGVEDFADRVVGGKTAENYPSYGWAAGSTLCGAVLVAKDMLLTAAHCEGAFINGVYIGGTKLNGSESQYKSVKEEIVSPNYGVRSSKDHDVMMLRLWSAANAPTMPMNFDTSVPAVSDKVTVLGYGAVEYGGSGSSILLDAEIQVTSYSYCNNMFGTIKDDTMICAMDDGKDTCSGDSGGPLISSDGTVLGVTSFGYRCGEPGVPGVYARLGGPIGSWVKKTICDHSDYLPEGFSCSTEAPTLAPVASTESPTASPTDSPIVTPSESPTSTESVEPTITSSAAPSGDPTPFPTIAPTPFPTMLPTASPTKPLVLSIEAAKVGPSVVATSDRETILNADFSRSNGGFVYQDDAFRGTAEPEYAYGRWARQKEALEIKLGGMDDQTIRGMSGGWYTEFDLPVVGAVQIAITYKLGAKKAYERKEYSQALCAIDGALIGSTSQQDYISQKNGGGSIGYETVTLDAGTLEAGTHRVTIGAFNNRKTEKKEKTQMLIRGVQIVSEPSTSKVVTADTTIIDPSIFGDDPVVVGSLNGVPTASPTAESTPAKDHSVCSQPCEDAYGMSGVLMASQDHTGTCTTTCIPESFLTTAKEYGYICNAC